MKKETQTQRVAKRLIECGRITTSEAMSQMYITRLAARVNDLKNSCFVHIESDMIKWGDSKQARYTVDEEARKRMIEAGAGAALVVAAEEEAAAKKAAEEKSSS